MKFEVRSMIVKSGGGHTINEVNECLKGVRL